MSKFVESARHVTLKQRNDMSYQGKIMFGTTPTRTENYLNVFNLGGEGYMQQSTRTSAH